MPISASYTGRLRWLILSALFSGFSAIAYQLLWGRQLTLVFGASQPAVAAVLAAFMLGLGVGMHLGGGWADRLRDPARCLAALEILLVVVGPALSGVLVVLPQVAASVLSADAADSPLFTVVRLGLAWLLLMLPTAVMGATFPILVRAAGDSLAEMHRAIARLYGANVVGGVAGVLCAGFLLLPRWGVPGTVAAAATASAAAGLGAWMARGSSAAGTTERSRRSWTWQRPGLRLIAAAALSGALVLAAESVWNRALALVLANSTTTFALLLGLTLAGLAAGAHLAGPILRRSTPLRDWARLQMVAAVLLLAQALVLPGVAHLARLVRPESGWPRVLLPPLVVGGVLILPVTLLLGAAWPLLLAAATPRVDDGGRRIGRLGVVNSFGAAAGAMVAGFLVLPAVGFGGSLLMLAGGHLLLASFGTRVAKGGAGARLRPALIVGAIVLASAALWLPRFGMVILPSLTAPSGREREVVLYRESAAGTVVVTENRRTGVRDVTVDNNAVIGTTYDALKVARMLGVVPALLHPRPQNALVIGFGTGVTTAALAFSPGVEDVEVVEIVPGVVEASQLFEDLNHGVAHRAGVRVGINDGRNHLLLSESSYDIITCDPVHPLYGSASLYSENFFALCRARLKPAGVVCQYLPLHRMPTPEFRRAIYTFRQIFPQTWVLFGLGHAMLVGSDQPLQLHWQRWSDLLRRHPLREDLKASALATPGQIAALIQLVPEASAEVGLGPASTDLHPYLEFLAPAAFEPELWQKNARLLVENYQSPLSEISGVPARAGPHLQRLIAGKRLLLFALLERNDGRLQGARGWLDKALAVAGEDPEIIYFARQARAEGW